jgi:hypothetical protein
MAERARIRSSDDWFIGTDQNLSFHVKDDDGIPVNVSAFAFSWMLKYTVNDADADALITLTSGSGISVTGAYNVDPVVNTQRVIVTISDSNTDSLEADRYQHELKRTDAGLETVLAYGSAVLKRGVHHA